MKKTSKWTIAIVSALALMVGVSSSSAVLFGSANDGLGGFTQSTLSTTNETWTTSAGSVQYRHQDTGTLNSSLLRQYSWLDRSIGSSIYMEGYVTMTDGYADDNNRLGMYLFGNAAEIPDQLEAGAIGLIFNTDDSSAGGSPGNNADDELSFRNGIDAGLIGSGALRNQSSTPYSQDLFGTTVKFLTVADFVSDGGGGTNINIKAWFTEADGTSTYIPMITVAATNHTGDYFGFVNRARARNYATDPTPEGRGSPWTMDYESFSIVPEPATLGLVAVMGGGILFFRRRFMM